MQILESERGNGRDQYPIRALWNSIIASYVFQHDSIEAPRRELLRNDRLRWLCGFALVVMLAKALGRMRENKRKKAGQEDRASPSVRSLGRTA